MIKKPYSDTVAALGVVFILIVAVFIGLALPGCSDGGKSSAGNSQLPAQVLAAQDMIRPYYPEAAAMTIKMGGVKEGYYAQAFLGGYAKIYDLWFDLYQVDRVDAACTIAHEHWHITHQHTIKGTKWRDIAEAEADIYEQDCIDLLHSKGVQK